MNLGSGLLMNNRNTMISLFTLSLVCLGNQNALAVTVYQWTDEAGNVNFSDVLPNESVTTEIREISINQYDVDNVDLERYSIINQLERMTQWRKQLKEERLAERRLILEEKRLAHEMELQLELSRRNEAIAAEEYTPRIYYYAPYQYRHHRLQGIEAYSHRPHQRHINMPSHRHSFSSKHVSVSPHRNSF